MLVGRRSSELSGHQNLKEIKKVTTLLRAVEGPAVHLSAATTLKTLHPNNQRQGSPTTLNLVIPSEAEGPAVRLS